MRASTIILILGIVGLAKSTVVDNKWGLFKAAHGKKYESTIEEMYRKSIFDKNVAMINEHNKLFLSGLKTYSMAVNKFTDRLREEVVGTGLPPRDDNSSRNFYTPMANANIPTEKDWRSVKGVVTPVKNQGKCGSCWAFSTTGSIEGQMMLRKNVSVSLSEQQLVDCVPENDCNGGFMDEAFDYIRTGGGIQSEETYPYEAKNQHCRFDKSKVVATISSWTHLREGDEEALTNAIATVGPVSITIVCTSSFFHYKQGIYVEEDCGGFANHAVLAVGYGTEDGLDYYIVKNTWGKEWGEHGYIRMARNKNDMCTIADGAIFPTI